MRATRIAPGIYQITIGMVNCFFCVDEKQRLTLIDTGMRGHADRIVAGLRSQGFRIDQVDTIILTHIHADHVGSAAELRRRSGARIAAHRDDTALIEQGTVFRPVTPGPGLLPRLAVPLLPILAPRSAEPVEIDIMLSDGDAVDGGGGFTVVHTPGHTAGHISLLSLSSEVLFVADAAANMHGIRGPFLYEDEQLARESVRRLAELRVDNAVFGHGRPIMGNAGEALDRLAREFGGV